MGTVSYSPRIGISRCLLGDEVRYDGGHKRDVFLTDILGPHVEWVAVCPEVEAGLGVPREPVRLVAAGSSVRVIGVTSGSDHTDRLRRWSQGRLRDLEALHLSGYVFKKDSPSCGIDRVRVYRRNDVTRSGVGIFAKAFTERFPLIPVEDEGRLHDLTVREHFVERVFGYWRWQQFRRARATRAGLIAFHTRHKFLLLAHSREHCETLGRLVGELSARPLGTLLARYASGFMSALKVPATRRTHANVLRPLVGHFTNRLNSPQKNEMLELVEDYRRGHVPLIAPITLIKHYATLFELTYLSEQVYLALHTKELMLRNHS